MRMATCETCGRRESREVKFYETLKLLVCRDCASHHFLRSNPELAEPANLPFKDVLGYSTKDIYKALSEQVVGQDKAKKVLAISLVNHIKRLVSDVKIDKSNVLLIGSTGTGKTFLVKALAEFTKTPFGMADATTITQSGWAGDDPESVLLDLYNNCEGDIKKVEKGIVFIDEIDKLAHHPESNNESTNYGAQRGLLKLLEGDVVNLAIGANRKNGAHEKLVPINTTNILFICAGAFSGLQDIIKDRLKTKSIGFTGNVSDEDVNYAESEVTTEDLEKYGFLSEFLGRIHFKTGLQDLKVQDLREILTKPEGSLISQYTELFSMDRIELEFSSTALEEIAKRAYDLKIGARGLRSIVDKVLFDYQYDFEGRSIYITKKTVVAKLGESNNNEIRHSHNRP